MLFEILGVSATFFNTVVLGELKAKELETTWEDLVGFFLCNSNKGLFKSIKKSFFLFSLIGFCVVNVLFIDGFFLISIYSSN